MTEPLTFLLNGVPVRAQAGSTVAAAVLNAGGFAFRQSVSGEARAPLCGMGICFECRLTINGSDHAKSCQIPLREGMEVRT